MTARDVKFVSRGEDHATNRSFVQVLSSLSARHNSSSVGVEDCSPKWCKSRPMICCAVCGFVWSIIAILSVMNLSERDLMLYQPRLA